MWWLLRSWLPLAVAVTCVFAVMYTVGQQTYRQSFNDPQVQLAEDAAQFVVQGAALKDVIPPGHVDIASGLAPWLVSYDASGTPVAASGYLHGQPARIPIGALTAARTGLPFISGHHLTASIPKGENRLTWQPEPGVREAVVIVATQNGYIVAGRNMREVETHKWTLSLIVACGWAVTMIATLLASWLGTRLAMFRND